MQTKYDNFFYGQVLIFCLNKSKYSIVIEILSFSNKNMILKVFDLSFLISQRTNRTTS